MTPFNEFPTMQVGARSIRARRVLAAATITFAAVFAAACAKKPAAAVASETPTVTIGPENVAIVEATDLASGPTLSGQLAPERSASIRSEVSASVLSVLHVQGEAVTAGTTLAKLDDTSIRDAWLSARSGVTSAQTAADQAQRDLQRATRLHDAGAIADRDLEAARRGDLAAQAQLADANARLAATKKQLDACDVKAPFTGIVSERQVSAGDVVAPGAPLFTVVDPGSMRLEAAIPASSLTDVRVGMRATFSVSGYGARKFDGRITSVNPSADPATGQVRIYASIPNGSGQLVAGLYAQGRVATATRRALSAPATAVDQRGLRPFVVRLKGGKPERVEVAIGVRDEEQERLEIVSTSIAAGDTLLLGAAQGISPGTRVKVSAPSDTTRRK